jgi:hypothetical protein
LYEIHAIKNNIFSSSCKLFSEFYLDFVLFFLQTECPLRRPPGIEIYRDSKIGCAIYEVDGAQHKLYCQNLCLLARLFLESKVICFNVSEFLFYVLMEYNDNNQKERFIGYFSKVFFFFYSLKYY